MPHFILEYSANVRDELNLDDLFRALNAAALGSGVFPAAGIRFRAVCCEDYLVADADPRNAFVHLTARIGAGRSLAARQAVGESMFKTLTEQLATLYETRPLAVSLEMAELTPGLNFKKNNMHQKPGAG